MRDNELQGNIAIDEYTEVSSGYSTYESTRAFLDEWAKANADENAEIKADTTERVATVCKVKVCKNGNLFVGCYDEQKTEFVNFFLKPAQVLQIAPRGLVVPVYETTPQGRRVQTAWNWADDDVLADAWKDKKVVYSGKILLEVF